jgi:hypothetical protein
MIDAVLDTTVVAIGNKDIAGRKAGNSFDRVLAVLEKILDGTVLVRYNNKLRVEYTEHVRERRNDFIENFFSILDSSQAIFVRKNSLSRQEYALAVVADRWPSHDQHLIAAAIGGENPTIYVTEHALDVCGARIYRDFDIHVVKV